MAYLDYRPLAEGEPSVDAILARAESQWIGADIERHALTYAIGNVVPEHLQEVRGQRLAWIDKTRAAVKDRLTKEIAYWDHRAQQLQQLEATGRANAKLNSQEARRRADDLQARLQNRLHQLDLEAHITAVPPVVMGGVVVVPAGLIAGMTGQTPRTAAAGDTQASAAKAREIVMEIERGLGFEPIDREFEKLGYDIESRDPRSGQLRFLEVKGRVEGADTVSVTRNEILYSLNKPEQFILALVEFLESGSHKAHYLRQPFNREPDFGVTSVNYDFAELLRRAEGPT